MWNWWRTDWVRVEYFPRTYAIGNQSSENSRKTSKSKALKPKILKSNHLHVDVQRYWLGEKRKIWTMYFNSNSEQVKNYAKNQSGIRDVRGCTTGDQIGTRRLARDPGPAVEKKPQFEIDLRVKRSTPRRHPTRWRKDERDQWTVGKVLKRDQAQHPFVTICRRVKWSWVKNQVALLSWSWSNWDELRRLFSVFLAWSTYQRDWSCVNAASGFDPIKQSTMNRIRTAFAALKTPYLRASVMISRREREVVTTHGKWIIKKTMDAKRGVLKRGKYTSLLDRWQNDEENRASQFVKTRPQKTRFRDVKYARIWDTDWVDDDRTKSDYNIQKKRTLYFELRMRGEMKLTFKTFLLNGETSGTNDNVKTKIQSNINTKHMKHNNDVTHLVNTWMCA